MFFCKKIFQILLDKSREPHFKTELSAGYSLKKYINLCTKIRPEERGTCVCPPRERT